ncbi:uncharacterized protein LOC122828610 [Gambusia affinis]|uniref:uncharacterized protein LOC122828610 n=1 Tax=Gambusia affinis TaxID=33528 RepID=UPI001CDB6F75|nr:uncharacterized protein LOC122828610 [Gambusia affinis]
MTRTKVQNRCPICRKNSWKLGLHLEAQHAVKNQTERRYLLAFAAGRVSVSGMACPVKACTYSGNRVDRHLKETHGQKGRAEQHLQQLQWSKTLQLLSELRRSEAQPPIASCLDVEGAQPAQPSPPGSPAASRHGSPAASRHGSPAASRHGSPAASRHGSPAASRHGSPAASRHGSPAASRHGSPAASRHGSPAASRHGSPAASRHGSPAASRHGSPAASRHGSPWYTQLSTVPWSRLIASSEEEDDDMEQPSPSSRVGRSRSPPPSTIFPPCICSYLAEYRVHLVGALPNAKHVENCGSKMTRLRIFLTHLSEGKSELESWQFMDDLRRIMAWPGRLKELGKAVTTIKVYLVNVAQFLAYFSDTPPPECTLSRAQMVRAVRAVKAASSQISTSVVLRQIRVKEVKERRMVTARLLLRCRTSARRKIPRLLQKLEAKPCAVELRHRFYGYFVLYVTALYGHRPGVITNLTTAEVRDARGRASSTSAGFVINVENHKTSRSFGVAQLYLDADEFGWITRWIAVRATLKPTCDLVLFSTTHGRVKSLARDAQRAWCEMGLRGNPTMTDIRSSVATLARNTQSVDVRSQMCRLMCHDTATADRYYAFKLGETQLAELRRRFEDATQPASTSSSEEEE